MVVAVTLFPTNVYLKHVQMCIAQVLFTFLNFVTLDSWLKGTRKSYPYSEFYFYFFQVNAAGDLCAICQEKMHAPILLRCKHIFCEDCVSEW